MSGLEGDEQTSQLSVDASGRERSFRQRWRSSKRFLIATLAATFVLSGCGSSGSDEESTSELTAEDSTAVQTKLAACADEWNKDGAEWNSVYTSDPDVLVTTDNAGLCLVAFSDDSGHLPGWVVHRDNNGAWSPYLTSETYGNDARIQVMMILNQQRLEAPNAAVVDPTDIETRIRFSVDAPLPPGALAEPALIVDPPSEKCDYWVDFSGGAIGDFRLLVLSAKGISCKKAQLIASDFPFFMTEWGCDGQKQISCEKGDVGFELERAPAGTPHPNAGATTSSASSDSSDAPQGKPFEFVPGLSDVDPTLIDTGDECQSIGLAPQSDWAMTDFTSDDFSCDEMTDLMMNWLTEDDELSSPEGFDCVSAPDGELGQVSTNITCTSADGTFGFNYF